MTSSSSPPSEFPPSNPSSSSSSSSSCWSPNPNYFTQTCQLLSQVTQPDSTIQQQLAQAFNQLLLLPDALCYLAAIFAGCPPAGCASPTLEVRQVAGLNLKTHLPSAAATVAAHVRPVVLVCVRDSERLIRSTAGSIVTAVINRCGASNWTEALEFLMEGVELACNGGGGTEAGDGSFDTLCKICEDELTIKSSSTNPSEADSNFITFCRARLLPKILDICCAATDAAAPPSTVLLASPSSSFSSCLRIHAVSCLSFFAQSHSFAPQAVFEDLFQRYWQALGVLAADESPDIRKPVVSSMVQVAEFHPQFLINSGEAVFRFMVEASGSPNYAVRLEALEFWPVLLREAPHKQLAVDMIRPHLPQLLRVLAEGTRYSEWDYLYMDAGQLEDDNAQVPDQISDMQPRFHKHAQANPEDDDEDDNKGTWGGGWTVRKGSALAVDVLASCFCEELLPDLLPIVEGRLAASEWDVRESAVLTLGAIAQGCMTGLSPYLAKVLDFLTKLCDESKPLLRSISCWCLARFSYWVCQPSNQAQWLQLVLAKILKHVLDTNKRVQEAACSAFATLEEEARELLLDYLPDIVQTLTQAFKFYQAKNLLILYDAVGTLAESVQTALQDEAIAKQLMDPLFVKWNCASPSEPSLIALYECISCCAAAMQKVFAPYAKPVVERCCSIIALTLKEIQDAQAEGKLEKVSNRELIECSLDLLSGVAEALGDQMPLLLKSIDVDIVRLLNQCCTDKQASVLQSSFALVGDLAKNCVSLLLPYLPEIIPTLSENILHPASSVSNNAGWAIGELCVRLGDNNAMDAHVDAITHNLILVLHKPQLHRSLLQNACITLGRLSSGRSAAGMARIQAEFLKPWCLIVQGARDDAEKVHAFQGICSLIMMNPEPASLCMGELVAAMLTFRYCPSQLENQFVIVLGGLRQHYKDKWRSFWHSAPPMMTQQMLERFHLSAE
eukprot:GHVS01042235.1.p1 GENE.GHVS01042235.1~~GHVS01042235.1.p1  ORF type:complete len:955 (+),score=190.28 GHVS01042235.1:129-2993(+)